MIQAMNELKPSKAIATFSDGSKCESYVHDDGSMMPCVDGSISTRSVGNAIVYYINAKATMDHLFDREPLQITLSAMPTDKILTLTASRQVTADLGKPFGYYNNVYVGREPVTPQPSHKPSFPARSSDTGTDCWTYPVIINSFNDIYPGTEFIMFNLNDLYTSMLAISDKDVISMIGPGPRIDVHLGIKRKEFGGAILISANSADPYESIQNVINALFEITPAKSRRSKKLPIFMNGLGWCTWNAMLGIDLNHEKIISVVKKIRDSGIPISWVLIDDGWQSLVNGALNEVDPDPTKFPGGFSALIDDLGKIGIQNVGLWFTINMYWRGVTENFLKTVSADAVKTEDGYLVPKPSIESSYIMFLNFMRKIKEKGFTFIKVDNQCSLRRSYVDISSAGEAARNVELGLQLASLTVGLDILNCMSMLPENYSNYVTSNSMRVSLDYIPLWIADAKLHTIWSFYNSLVYSAIGYPDFDMWSSYDEWAKVSAIARIFSGGPIYITDREPEKTNVDLLKKIVMSNGEVVRVDEPGTITRDILFRDPYNENVLLKIAATVNGIPVLAVMNLNKDDIDIEEDIDLGIVGIKDTSKYVYYMVFSGKYGRPNNGKISIKLGGLDAEIIVISRLINGNALIGLRNYILPPYPLSMYSDGNSICFKSRTNGYVSIFDAANDEVRDILINEGEIKCLSGL
jgi:hypothetical protein